MLGGSEMAASDETDQAFEDYLLANWSRCPLFFENDEDEPHDPQQSWVYVENESDDDDQESIGAGEGNLWREVGTLRLYVLIPIGSGAKAGRLLRDALADLLKGQEIGPVTCGAAHRVAGLRWEGEGNGNWWAMPLTIDWTRDDDNKGD